MRSKLCSAALMTLMLTGCAPRAQVQTLQAYVPNSADGYSDADFAQLLSAVVHNGLVDYSAVGQHRDTLERYLAQLSVIGPESAPALFPSAAHRACYYINAYNAGVLRAVLDHYPTDSIYRLNLPDPDDGYTFQIDRRRHTLHALRQQLLDASQGDGRTLLTLSGAALGAPPLAAQPYRPEAFDAQLQAAVTRVANDPRLLDIDHDTRTVRYWLPMVSDRHVFLDTQRRLSGSGDGSLLGFFLQFADGPAQGRLRAAQSYSEGILPFDRRLNDARNVG